MATATDLYEMAETSGAPLEHPDRFVRRHIGPTPEKQLEMLATIGYSSLDSMVDAAIPGSIRLNRRLDLPEAVSEADALGLLKAIAGRNKVFRSYLGMGYHDCITPAVIQRNVLENPGWYTQYTPYQAEIAQGRLEGLLTFQTVICDLTAMEVANASLLDEATAAAEAMIMCFGIRHTEARDRYLVDANCHPQNIAVLQTQAKPLGIELVIAPSESFHIDNRVFGVLVQYPGTDGTVRDHTELISKAHVAGAMAVMAADLLSLCLLRPPGELGADVAIGSAQRFGVPLGYGGPHAAFFATREAFKRQMPGRLVGVSKDARGKPAFRLSLQTREQHIRREKATSNICTAQALLANVAAMYAVYHGPRQLKRIAIRIHALARTLAAGLRNLGFSIGDAPFFDTVRVDLGGRDSKRILEVAEVHRINLRLLDERTITVALDETTSLSDVAELLRVFNEDRPPGFDVAALAQTQGAGLALPESLVRRSGFLTAPVFNRHHSETEMLRFLRRLEARDLSLTASMIPLGSCTMKLNATTEMVPISWPEFNRLHPIAPPSQAAGYQELFADLERWLAEITGLAAVSLQPNAGSQGEYAGLMVIRAFHADRGEGHRNVCLIPASAHGTNPASAVKAGLKVVPVACDKNGNIDLADLEARAEAHASDLACIMVTYPSTHGVFEQRIREVCAIVHRCGGQVYMDGANMNAQVALCRPAEIGADVCHLNLHKTFSIPHGGGGPGVGPIAVAAHLADYIPGHPLFVGDRSKRSGPVSAAPWGSASILPISWTYIRMMGPDGLAEATKVAILNANYIAARLENYFPVLYRGLAGLVAHECILDLRAFKAVTVEDVAKRLMDYGFHAPTVSWPVPGTIMVEPTESESKEELDRFCDAMISIHAEMKAIEAGQSDPKNSLLKNAPHPAEVVAGDRWDKPYSREQAAFPAPWLREFKFWPAVARIDNVYGDRNLVCSCAGFEGLEGGSTDVTAARSSR